MPSFKPLTSETLPHFRIRIEAIDASKPPLWGKMNTAAMFKHLRLYTECALGIRKMEDRSNPVSRFLIKAWFRSSIGFGKGMPTLEIMKPSSFEEAEAEKALLVKRWEEFTAAVDSEPDRIEINEMMGPVPLKEWAIYNGKHIDHHLRQFDV